MLKPDKFSEMSNAHAYVDVLSLVCRYPFSQRSVDDTLTLIIKVGRIQFIFTEINHEYLSRDAMLYAH